VNNHLDISGGPITHYSAFIIIGLEIYVTYSIKLLCPAFRTWLSVRIISFSIPFIKFSKAHPLLKIAL
jgi:hypothetical protein